MKDAQGYRGHLPSYTLILLASLVLGVAGCGESDSIPIEPAQTSQGSDSTTAKTTPTETPPPPPGGMELPSNLDISDAPTTSSETGSSFELPE